MLTPLQHFKLQQTQQAVLGLVQVAESFDAAILAIEYSIESADTAALRRNAVLHDYIIAAYESSELSELKAMLERVRDQYLAIISQHSGYPLTVDDLRTKFENHIR
jgi:hypothetical protein